MRCYTRQIYNELLVDEVRKLVQHWQILGDQLVTGYFASDTIFLFTPPITRTLP